MFVSLPFYRGITVGIAPHPQGNPVRCDTVPTVLPQMWSPLPRFPRLLQYSRHPHYRADLYYRLTILGYQSGLSNEYLSDDLPSQSLDWYKTDDLLNQVTEFTGTGRNGLM